MTALTEQLVEQRASYWANTEYPHFDVKRKVILEALRRGNSRLAAIRITKISKLVFDFWMDNDEEWQEAVDQAEAASEIDMVGIITTHAGKDWRAAIEMLKMRRSESWSTLEQRLAVERAKVEKQKAEANLVLAQATELKTRADRNLIESAMWQKQFVTEEAQQDMIQSLANAVNKPLLELTPEKYIALIKGKTEEQQLEILKGYLGRSQSTIVEEVMRGSGFSTETDDEEEDEEE